jgi:hypothetical protein
LLLVGVMLVVYAGSRLFAIHQACSIIPTPNANDQMTQYFTSQRLAENWEFRSSVIDIVRPIGGSTDTVVIIDRKANSVYWSGWVQFGELRAGDERISVKEFQKRMNAKFGRVVCIKD